MIPKTIHYCWFGRGKKTELVEFCMKSWKKFCPEYQVVEWNEDNFDLSACPLYVQQAYNAKKWAYVTDYVRLKVVYEHGGIYLDTDVELIKPLDGLLEAKAYFGYEEGINIATGLGFGAEAGTPILLDMMREYDDIPFIKDDGSYDSTPCPQRNTKAFLPLGLKQDNSMQQLDGGIMIYPKSWFCPITFLTAVKKVTKQTVSIHHFAASWMSEENAKNRKKQERKKRFIQRKHAVLHFPNKMLKKVLGDKLYGKFKAKLKR